MKLEQIDNSIVIIADRHNPSILHPSFLENKGIIDAGTDLAEPPLCTAEISIASFKNGLRFTVDTSRLQITNQILNENDFDISKIASSYVKELPNVDYKSVGCNLFMFIEKEDAESFLISKFIKHGTWNRGTSTLDSAGLRFVYSTDEGQINISYDAGEIVKNGDQPRSGILIKGNYHTNVSGIDETISILNSFSSKMEMLASYMETTFEDEI